MTVSRRRFASALAALTAAGALAACNNDDVPVEDGASPGGGSGGSTKPGSGGSTKPGSGGSTKPGSGGSTKPGSGGSTGPGSGSPTAPATRDDLYVKASTIGQTLSVSLKCDPDSDASWSYTMSPEGLLKETKSELYTANDGKPHVQFYDFESVANGEVTLTFTYGSASGPIQVSEVSCTISGDQKVVTVKK